MWQISVGIAVLLPTTTKHPRAFCLKTNTLRRHILAGHWAANHFKILQDGGVFMSLNLSSKCFAEWLIPGMGSKIKGSVISGRSLTDSCPPVTCYRQWRLVQHPQITPSVRGNGTGSVVLKACPVQGCLFGARISASRQYSTSLWYEVICVIRGAIGATSLWDRQPSMLLPVRYAEAFILLSHQRSLQSFSSSHTNMSSAVVFNISGHLMHCDNLVKLFHLL